MKQNMLESFEAGVLATIGCIVLWWVNDTRACYFARSFIADRS
jgi:hypothetical protein